MTKKELKKLIKDACPAPEPLEKEAFIKSLRPRRVGTARMILCQIPYIRAHVWIAALSIIMLTVCAVMLGRPETEDVITLLMPFTAAVGVAETFRSVRYNMSELEAATRFSLRSVAFARMVILGCLSFITIAVVSPVISLSFGGTIVETAVRILIPYLITMIVNLHIERMGLGGTYGITSVIVAGTVSALTFLITEPAAELFLRHGLDIAGFGIPAVIILFAITCLEQWQTVRKMEAFA